MKVSEILKQKGTVVVTKPSDSVAELSRLLSERRIGAVVVSDNGATIDLHG